MTSTQVNSLRKSGKLKEATILAQEILEKDPGSVWNKRAIAWCYYEYLKLKKDKINTFIKVLKQINHLGLGDTEGIFFDSCAYQIVSALSQAKQENKLTNNLIDQVFTLIKDFHFTRPSEAFSALIKLFTKLSSEWPRYLGFIEWCGLNNFTEADYKVTIYNERKQIALVEQVYTKLGKQLLSVNPLISATDRKHAIERYLPAFDSLVKEQTSYNYPLYYQVKLMLAINKKDGLLEMFLPFARKKQTEFWVWDLMADICSDDIEKKKACLVKALSLKGKEEFKLKTRERLAALLIQEKEYAWAKKEIALITEVRESNDWKINNSLINWMNTAWYSSTEAKIDRVVRSHYIQLAEETLFGELPEEVIVVQYYHAQKRELTFVKDKNKFGFFKVNGFKGKIFPGDLIRVRFQESNGKRLRYQVVSMEKVKGKPEHPAIKDFEGSFRKQNKNTFGFQDDIFIDARLVESNGLKNGDLVSGYAVLTLDKKHQKWGWRAVRINRTN